LLKREAAVREHFDPNSRRYASLSVKDLLDAREACHVQFAHSSNVFATAVGLYRIRTADPDGKRYVPVNHATAQRGKLGPRTLENTVVQPWSWPCVLVFVREWLTPAQLHGHADHPIPQFIFLNDGRVVPVCVLEATLATGLPAPVTGPLTFTSQIVGGGYHVLTEVQGKEHVGSIACVVTDGDRYFGLTNQHVAGTAEREIFTLVKGERVRIGKSADAARRDVPFTSIYEGFAGTATRANLDIGLIDIDDISLWTAQVFGLGVLDEVMNFDVASASLDWIGLPLLAHGASAGKIEGEIKALFYRYRTLNGVDYVSDFLIGGRDRNPLQTGPGDSGTLWCLDPIALRDPGDTARTRASREHARQALRPAAEMPERYRPVAVEWGGQKLNSNGVDTYTQYALASSVAVACRELDVEVVTDLNAEHTQYWGAVGHYKIAQIAIDQVKSADLKAFLKANLTQLTFDSAKISTGDIPHDASKFVPLADVPDIVWKTNMNRGGKAARAQENWNHYADMDLPGPDGRTLSQMCGDPAVLDINAWINFYKTAKPPAKAKSKFNNMGALPFRAWQVFDAMVGFRKAATGAENFLCAAGILSHYIGDACQPLHGSMHADGLNGASTGVHSAYEEKMIDKFAVDLADALDKFKFGSLEADTASVTTGHDAARTVVNLMRRAAKRLEPTDICGVYDNAGGGAGAAVIKALWDSCGVATIACIADGARTLAKLWDAAYAAGGKKFSGAVSPARLKTIYEAKTFLPSLHLANLDPKDYPLPKGTAAANAPAPKKPAKPKAPTARKKAAKRKKK
jgi:hypothetical protein